MLFRCLSLGLLFLTLISATALADGGFYGTVTYNNCDCTLAGDKVMIVPVSGGDPDECGIDCSPCCGYNTQGCDPVTFPPGTFKLWVHLDAGTDSCATAIKIVEHGSESQEVNLTVQGPLSKPNSPGDE